MELVIRADTPSEALALDATFKRAPQNLAIEKIMV